MMLFKINKQLNLLEKNQTCCLSGHRPKNLPWNYNEMSNGFINFKNDLKNIFIKAINYGLKYFLTGMAEGFDMIATEILFDIKKDFDKIKVIAVLPCKNQEKLWSKNQQEKYHSLLKQCDNIITLSDKYTHTCMNERNKFMVNNSSVIIACFNGSFGGTKNTINFAKENNLKIKIINPNHYLF